VKILAQSVFEGVVYHCSPIDLRHPERPTLEVDALLRPGDADDGPLLLPVADYVRMLGVDVARPCLHELAARGRLVRRLDVEHIAFPTWVARAPG
jgi:hypothetical protein